MLICLQRVTAAALKRLVLSMNNTLPDFLSRFKLHPLAVVVRAMQAASKVGTEEFMLIGTAARDMWLQHGYAIDTGRETRDVDFAVAVENWESFSRRRETMNKSQAELLPEDVHVRVANSAALALLKITAWHDRKYEGPDAKDLLLYLRKYLDCGRLDRAMSEHADLFEAEDFEYEEVSTFVLGRDIAALLDRSSAKNVLTILAEEIDPDGRAVLAHQSGLEITRACSLLAALADGLSGTSR
jgi:predicted nucleotidyltransferase